MLRLRLFFAPFLIGLIALVGESRAQEIAAPSPLDALLNLIEQFETHPESLTEAREALKKRVDEAQKNAGDAKLEVEKAAAGKDAKAKKLEFLKAEQTNLEKHLEAAKAELAAIEKELPAIDGQVESAKKADENARRKVELIERSLQLLAALGEPKKVETASADLKTAEASQTIAPEALEFFENKIRPVLMEHCAKCHGPDKQKSDLRVDSLAALIKGGAEGTALVPGDPEKSALIKAIRYDGETMMPPDGKLPDAVIADLTEWVKMGAPWPEIKKPADGPSDAKVASEQGHWAFRPVKNPLPPVVKSADRVGNPIDAFLLAKLEEKGLQFSPAANKRTLIRRATFDLIGLPPTGEEIATFEADASPDAFAKLVDRLLASPHYGERWGRYWLDVARYADTRGYVFEEERRYAFSFTYRDYVIRAFNEDLPYDQFLIQQIAADQLDLKDDQRPLAAMGFLTLGRRFLNAANDIIDDRIDVVTRGTMGLTVQCARCHDHKFDPIPTEDYYSLHGIFASSQEPAELPLIGDSPPAELLDEYNKELEKRQDEVDRFFRTKHATFLADYRGRTADFLDAAQASLKIEDEEQFQILARDRKVDHHILKRWKTYLAKVSNEHQPVLAAWTAFAAIPDDEFTTQTVALSQQITANADPAHKHNALVAKAFASAPASRQEVKDRYHALFTEADHAWGDLLQSYNQMSVLEGAKAPAPPAALPDPAQEEVRQLLYGPEAPGNAPASMVEELMDLEMRAQLKGRRRAVDNHKAIHPGRPPRAHVMKDADKPHDSAVLIRGAAGNKGPTVPRHFLSAIAGENPKPFENGSGRLELAQAIVSRDNPLTARVFVNRVWLNHFGAAIVGTPSDFGTRSDFPTHPELLDHLASRFMDEGWSIKKLHRMIMLSSAYQQVSDWNETAAAADPENRLLWRFNRRRLDFESLRDSLLAVAGQLDTTMGGPSVPIADPPYTPRRTVYGFVDRQNLPGLFRTFDFASPDATSPKRFQTTIPQQALFMMNSSFVMEQARRLESNPQVKEAAEETEKIRRLNKVVYGREASEEEVQLGLSFVEKQKVQQPIIRAWQYGYGDYEETTGTLKSFTPFPGFAEGRWGGGGPIPDPALGFLFVTRAGGHPGETHEKSAIRRWTAPRDGVIEIMGTVNHEAEAGDGIAAHIHSGILGRLGKWEAYHTAVETKLDRVEVAMGDTIDFVITCRANSNNDSFKWAPTIKMIEERAAANQIGSGPSSWDAASDFSGPPPEPLDPLGEYAQVLLLANEFAFVD